VIGNGWFQNRRSRKITHYTWDGKFRTIIHYFIMTINLCNILKNVKLIPSIRSEEENRILIAGFRKIMDVKPILYTGRGRGQNIDAKR
jgi:hypothetical protein